MTCHNILLGDGDAWQCLDVSNSAHPWIPVAFFSIIVLLWIGAILLDRHFHKEEIGLLRDIDKTEHEILRQLTLQRPSFIKIRFKKGNIVMPLGPVTIVVGQKTVASLVIFDQNGVDMTSKYDFTANPITWALDNTTFDSQSATGPDSSNADTITSLAAGTANLSATTGKLSDVEQVINQAQAQVATSAKISFTTPA
jgi:hypothetical protein